MRKRVKETTERKKIVSYDSKSALGRIRGILLGKGLVDPEEELGEAMLEDLVHYAYFTGCIARGDVRQLLGLTVKEARAKIRSWKKWHEGNRHCQLRQNPFYEDWPAEES